MGERRVSLLVRNISRRLRPEDIKKEFERYGDVRDVYIPRDYYTKEPKGFSFVEFEDERDADDARRNLDGVRIDGREIRVVFAQERRKSTEQMRERERKERGLRTGGRSRSRSPPRRRAPRGRSRSRSRDRRAPPRRSSRSRSRSRSRSASPRRSASPHRSPSPRRSLSPRRSRSPRRSASASPRRDDGRRSPSGSPLRSSGRDDGDYRD